LELSILHVLLLSGSILNVSHYFACWAGKNLFFYMGFAVIGERAHSPDHLQRIGSLHWVEDKRNRLRGLSTAGPEKDSRASTRFTAVAAAGLV
jgi:hypothetical protein